MDLFKKMIEMSNKQFPQKGSAVKHDYMWECSRCTHKVPAEKVGGKLNVKPPSFCKVEHCSGSTFRLCVVDKE